MNDIPNYYKEWHPTKEQHEAVERENEKRYKKCQEQLKKPIKKKR